jgi:hypothetical protein
VLALYEERVAPQFRGFSFVAFHGHTKTLCRVYLKKNPP